MKWTGTDGNVQDAFKKNMGCLGKAPAEPIKVEEIKVEIKEEKKEEKKVAPVKPAAKPKKVPTKTFKYGRCWEIYDYGEEEIVFKEEDVKINMIFNFYNCVKTTVRIEGKASQASFFSCKKMKLHVNKMIAQVEMLKSDEMKLYPIVSVPQVVIEHCK